LPKGYWGNPPIASTQEGASHELLNEYETIVNKYKSPGKEWWKGFDAMNATDYARLEEIFKQMSREQQHKQIVAFRGPIAPLSKAIPTAKQMEDWRNEKVYGVWINGKRVKNEVLNNYHHTDFSQANVSKLSPNAINYGKHFYQVNLMTNEYYQSYYDLSIADNKNVIMFRGFTFQN